MTDSPQWRLRPDCLIVLEGLDRTGKTTQISRLRTLEWSTPQPTFAHLPSGITALTDNIYRLTEREKIRSPLSRQLLHLACHAENMADFTKARNCGGLVLDRWWWSTVAYGWHGGHLAESNVDESAFFGMINTVWQNQPADLIFLFMTPYVHDDLNQEAVRIGYRQLAEDHAATVIEVSPGGPDDIANSLLNNLRERELLQRLPDKPA